MKAELYSYDVYPKVVPAGRKTKVTICAAGVRPFEDRAYAVAVRALSNGAPGSFRQVCAAEFTASPDENGGLTVEYDFPEEGEYFLRVSAGEAKPLQLSVFAVGRDLAGRLPRIGDLHLHTYRSDGHEAPAIVAANYRAFGYDFLAITDHGRYYPSLEAIAAYDGVDHALAMVPGEEVHLPGNEVHLINFGGTYSVNAMIETSPQNREAGTQASVRTYGADGRCPEIMSEGEFRGRIEALAASLDLPESVEPFPYAACVWAFEQIRNAGGVGIFAHPYWISDLFQLPESFTDFMLERHPFDAFEVLGGERYYEQNGFQAAKYYDSRRRGVDFPVVGSTDSHSSLPTNRCAYVARTMVFTPANDRRALVDSIRSSYSVAIDGTMPEPRLVGDFRFVKYAWFLLENYFPLHDLLTAEDGRLMKCYALSRDPGEKADYARRIAENKAELARLEKKYFAF